MFDPNKPARTVHGHTPVRFLGELRGASVPLVFAFPDGSFENREYAMCVKQDGTDVILLNNLENIPEVEDNLSVQGDNEQ